MAYSIRNAQPLPVPIYLSANAEFTTVDNGACNVLAKSTESVRRSRPHIQKYRYTQKDTDTEIEIEKHGDR